MGMAASQVRLLQLTSRKHAIGVELEHLSLQKMSLTREMQQVSRDYNNALSSKTMKWSNNSGVTYTDISYSTLMRPNSANNYNPVLLTNSSGKVVVDSKYKKYAEMISADGNPGGVWDGGDGQPRINILAALTGIDASKIAELNSAKSVQSDADTTRTKALNALESWEAQESSKGKMEYVTAEELAAKIDKYGDNDLGELYRSETGTIHIGSVTEFKAFVDHIKNSLNKYFVDDKENMKIEDKTAFEKACEDCKTSYNTLFGDDSEKGGDRRASANVTGSLNDWDVRFSTVLNTILKNYTGTKGTNKNKELVFPLRDTTSGSDWDTWHKQLITLNSEYESSEKVYAEAANKKNEVFTADIETQIAFFDKIFEAIVDNGWVEDVYVQDNDYLNQKLQNNDYCLTTITPNTSYDEDLGNIANNNKYIYDSNIASNCDNIFMVNEQKTRDDAQAEYEYKKSIINEKESRMDTRMKNLETEQSSIVKMMESIEKVKKDNIETHLSVFS